MLSCKKILDCLSIGSLGKFFSIMSIFIPFSIVHLLKVTEQTKNMKLYFYCSRLEYKYHILAFNVQYVIRLPPNQRESHRLTSSNQPAHH